MSFDSVFADYERSSRLRDLFGATLDAALPAEIEPFSFVPLAALRAITRAVDVRGGGLLVDLGCGRGGPGMWAARTSGARLVGVDRSLVAVTQARSARCTRRRWIWTRGATRAWSVCSGRPAKPYPSRLACGACWWLPSDQPDPRVRQRR